MQGFKRHHKELMQHPHGSILKADFDWMNTLILRSPGDTTDDKPSDGKGQRIIPQFQGLEGVALYFFEPVHLFVKKEGRRIAV